MKTFVAILAIVASVGTFILFENVNGEGAPFTLISSDGSYTPGSIKGWDGLFNQVRKYTDQAGLEDLQAAQNLLGPVDEAMRTRDLLGALKIARQCTQYFDKFIPHVNNPDLKQYLVDGNVRIRSFIDSVEKKGPTLFALNHFLTSEFTNLGGILSGLLKKVGELLHGVGGAVGGLVHSLKLKV